MSNQLKMAQIHTIEQLLRHGWSHRRIARELDIHRDTVVRYARGRPPDPDSKPAISTAGVAGRKCECHPHRETIVAKLTLGLTAQRIHQDLVAEHGYAHSYESVKCFVRKLGASRPIPFRRTKSPTGQAIGYAKNQWAALCRYIESGDLEIDNNRAERNLRTIAVGRKNWTFVGNETFGEKAAVIYSLVASCREIGVEPRVYVWDVMQRIGAETDVAKLTPHGWKPHFSDQATAAWGRFIARLATATVPGSTI